MVAKLSQIMMLAALAMMLPLATHADVIVDVENTDPVVAGASVSVDVVYSGDATVTGFNMPTDVNSDGRADFSPLVTLDSITPNAAFGATSSPTPNASFNFDFSVSNTMGGNLDLGVAGPTVMYTMEFTTNAGLAPGTVIPIIIQPNPTPVAGLFAIGGSSPADVNSVGPITVNAGSITIIPEPGSIALLSLVCGGLMLRRRR